MVCSPWHDRHHVGESQARARLLACALHPSPRRRELGSPSQRVHTELRPDRGRQGRSAVSGRQTTEPGTSAMGSSSVCHSLAASHASIGRIQHTQLATAVLPAVDVSRGERELRRSTDARGQKELRRRTVARGRKAVAAFQQRESPPSCECRSEPPRRSLVLGALAAAGAALTQSLPLPPHGQEAQAAEGPEVLTPFESEADCYRLLVPKGSRLLSNPLLSSSLLSAWRRSAPPLRGPGLGTRRGIPK